MREYTSILTIKVIASVMAVSEHDAHIRAWGTYYVEGEDEVERELLRNPQSLVRPQLIGVTTYHTNSQGNDGFKARSFREAAREISPDIEPDCEARPMIFPIGYPGLPSP